MVRAFIVRSAAATMASLFVMGGVNGAFAEEASKESVIATVNGKDITSTEMGFISDELGPRLGELSEEEKQKRLLDVLVDLNIVAQAAAEQGLDKTEAFDKQMRFLRLRALQNEFFRKNVDEAITDEALQAAYDEQIGSLPAKQEVRARHILVKEEAEALDIIKELDGGADFAELAKSKSTGPSGPKGGDLGYFGPGQMVPPFEAAAFALEKGDYTKKPVKTQFGWHVIQVEDKRDVAKPTLDQVKDQLRSFLAQQKFTTLITDLREKAKVERK